MARNQNQSTDQWISTEDASPYSALDSNDSSSFGRGVDQLQASLYGFATAIGNLSGFDALEEWGAEGVERNMREIAKNPPEIHSWDDVDSLSDFGTYFVESLGEQAPQLLMDLAIGLGTGGAGLGLRTAGGVAVKQFTKKQLAQIGKKVRRMPKMQTAFDGFNAAKGRTPTAMLDAASKAATKVSNVSAPVAGVMASNFAQNTGETQMTFLQEGIDAPGTAVLAGAFKAGLDTLAPAKLLGIAKKANVPAESLPQVFARASKELGGTAVMEGGTEAAQTIVDHVAQNIHDPDFEMFDEAAWSEIWTAATKGAIVGGTLGGGVSAVREGIAYQQDRDQLISEAERDAMELAVDALDPNTGGTNTIEQAAADTMPPMEAESQETIDAQAAAIDDPTSTKDTMEVTTGSPMPTQMPEGAIEVESETGTIITTNPEKAELVAQTGGDEETRGQVIYNASGGKTKANGEVVVARDAEGQPIFERATNPDDIESDIAEAERQAPAGGRVEVDSAENVVAARTATRDGEESAQTVEQEAQAELEASALRAATNEWAKGDQQKAKFALSILNGERQVDERLQANLTAQISPIYRKALEESADYTEPTREVEVADGVDPSLVEGASVERVIRPGINLTRGEEVIGYSNREGAEQMLARALEDEGVAEAQVVEQGGRFFVEEQLVPEQLASSPLIQRNPELTPTATPGRTTLNQYVNDFVLDMNQKAQRRRRLQAKLPTEKRKQLVEDSIIKLRDADGFEHEVLANDLFSLGQEILAVDRPTDTLEGASWFEAAWTRGVAELRARGYEPVGNNRNPMIGAINFRTGRGEATRLRGVIEQDRRNRASGQDSPQSPFRAGDSNDPDAPRVDIIGDEVTIAATQKRLKAVKRRQAEAERQIDEILALPDAERNQGELRRVQERLDELDRLEWSLNQTLENFARGEEPVRTSEEEIAGEDGVENMAEQTDGLLYESDQYQQADGTPIDTARTSIPTRGNRRFVSEDRPRRVSPAEGKNAVVTTKGYGRISQEAVDFVTGILASVGLGDVNFAIANDADIEELLADGTLDQRQVEEIRAKFEENPDRNAVFVPLGKTGVIVIRPIANRDMYLSTLGHEVGHGVYNALEQTILNPQNAREKALQKRLFDAYRADRDRSETYAAKGGFKEWFADKIAAHGRGLARNKDRGLTERFFESSAAKLRKVFNKTKEKTHPRLHRNLKFENVIHAYRNDGVFARIHSMGYGQIESMIVPDAETTADFLDQQKLRQGVTMMRELATNGWGSNRLRDSVLRKLLDVDTRLRWLGFSNIANLIYKQTSSQEGRKAYWPAVENARAEFMGKAHRITRGLSEARKEKIYWDLANQVEDSQLTSEGKQLRALIKEFHQYLLDSGLPMGEEANYFPRNYDINAILSDPKKFMGVLEEHGYSGEQALKAFETIASPPRYKDMEGFAPKRLPAMFNRQISVEAARGLMDAGMLNANPEEALAHYINKYTREAEHRRLFGGWHYLNGYTTAESRGKMEEVPRRQAEAENRKILEGYLERYGFLTPLTNTQRSQEDLTKDFNQAITEATKQGFVQVDPDGDYLWIHPDARLDAELRRAVRDHIEQNGLDEEQGLALTEEVRLLVDKALDRADPADPTSKLYNFIGEVRAYESLRTLSFSGVASIPELAAAFARTRGALGAGDFARTVIDHAKNSDEMLELAKAIGIVSEQMGSSMATELGGSVYDGYGNFRFFRNLLPYMFKYNLNDQVVRHSRAIALGMGMEFIRESARQAANGSARHTRYLTELGIDAGTVQRFFASVGPKNDLESAMTQEGEGVAGQDAQLVREALRRFVNESVLRPNAAERPTWANHPIGTFVFHLKTFAYSFTKNISFGVVREVESRAGEMSQDGSSKRQIAYEVATSLAPMIFVFVAFGAVSDELRERIKSFGARGTLSNRSLGEAGWKWIDRTGLITSVPFLEPTVQLALEGNVGYNASYALGPASSHLYDLVGDNNGLTQNEVVRSIPIVSQLPFLRNALYSDFR